MPKHSTRPKPLHPRSDMTTSSHLTHAPASQKPTKAQAICSSDVIPFLWQHPPWCWPPPPKGSGGRPHGRPPQHLPTPRMQCSQKQPPRQHIIRGNMFFRALHVWEGEGLWGGRTACLQGGGKIKQAVLPYRAYLPNSHLAGGNINISEES